MSGPALRLVGRHLDGELHLPAVLGRFLNSSLSTGSAFFSAQPDSLAIELSKIADIGQGVIVDPLEELLHAQDDMIAAHDVFKYHLNELSTSRLLPPEHKMMAYKFTKDFSPELLMKLQQKETLSSQELTAFYAGRERFFEKMALCQKSGIPVKIDAEMCSVQTEIDAMVKEATLLFPATIVHTFQCYRKDTLARVTDYLVWCSNLGVEPNLTLVRGAYLGSDTAAGFGDMFCRSKADTDAMYNRCMQLVLIAAAEQLIPELLGLGVCTHNENSMHRLYNTLFTQFLEKGLDIPPVWSAHLKGMGDSMGAMSVALGLRTFTFLPVGDDEHAGPYFYRRLVEHIKDVAERAKLEFGVALDAMSQSASARDAAMRPATQADVVALTDGRRVAKLLAANVRPVPPAVDRGRFLARCGLDEIDV